MRERETDTHKQKLHHVCCGVCVKMVCMQESCVIDHKHTQRYAHRIVMDMLICLCVNEIIAVFYVTIGLAQWEYILGFCCGHNCPLIGGLMVFSGLDSKPIIGFTHSIGLISAFPIVTFCTRFRFIVFGIAVAFVGLFFCVVSLSRSGYVGLKK